MLESMLGSSTPDGLAPMSLFALSVFTFSFGGIAVLWGIFNLIQLLRLGPDDESQGIALQTPETQQIRQMGAKIILGSLHYMKFNFIVILVTVLIYFLTIMGAVQQFDKFDLSIHYLLGALGAILISFLIVVVSSLSYFRIVYSSRQSTQDAFSAAKKASNSITFISTGMTLAALIGIMMKSQPIDKTSEDQINNRANLLISFAFGYITVAMCTKITSLVYSKGVQNSFQVCTLFNHNLTKDSKHPMVICKGIGETVNRSLSKTLDFLVFMTTVVGIVTKAAGMNVLGVDQKGEIIFTLSSDNCYSAILLIGYSLFFTTLFSLFPGSPSNQGQVKTYFRINIVGIYIFLSGFTALACYLTLPAQFQIFQFIQVDNTSVISPLYGYLPVLIAMTASLFISLSAQIFSSSLYFVYSLLKSCKTGAATCLISGLSKGYFYNFIPIVTIAPLGFLCYHWLGILGVSMGLVGIALFIPHYMNVNLYHSIINSASMVGYVSKANQNSIGSLLALNESKKYFEQKIFIYFNQLSALLGYVFIAVFSQRSKNQFSISQPHLFSGLLVGSMTPYMLSALCIKASFSVAPVICYDVQQQVQQNPGIAKGNVEIDFYRSNQLFTLNVVTQTLKFLPILILPNIVAGMLLSLQSILGFMGGLTLSSLQLSMSSSMSGSLWANTKDEISYGRAKDQQDNDIAADSQWGQAAQVGNNVGSTLKDCSGQSVYIYLFWTLVMATLFEDLFIRIHSD